MFFKKKYDKIFVVSCVVLDNKKVKITYYIKNKIEFDIYKGLFEKSIVSDNINLFEKIKIGEWVKVKLDYVGNILYLYN